MKNVNNSKLRIIPLGGLEQIGIDVYKRQALKLGAGYALGTDLDPCAVTAVKENMDQKFIDVYKRQLFNASMVSS